MTKSCLQSSVLLCKQVLHNHRCQCAEVHEGHDSTTDNEEFTVWISGSECAGCGSYKCCLSCFSLLPCYSPTNTGPLFVRVKPAEQIPPMLSPSDLDTKLQGNKSQPLQVGVHSQFCNHLITFSGKQNYGIVTDFFFFFFFVVVKDK